jgi:hypothetical protein
MDRISDEREQRGWWDSHTFRGLVVRLDDGSPIAGAEVVLVPPQGYLYSCTSTSSRDGRFELSDADDYRFARHPYRTKLQITAAGYRQSEPEVEMTDSGHDLGKFTLTPLADRPARSSTFVLRREDVDTGIDVEAGELVEFAVGGSVMYRDASTIGPFARIGGPGEILFRIGDSERWSPIGWKEDARIATDSGRLSLRPNVEATGYVSGAFTVEVTISRKRR